MGVELHNKIAKIVSPKDRPIIFSKRCEMVREILQAVYEDLKKGSPSLEGTLIGIMMCQPDAGFALEMFADDWAQDNGIPVDR